MYKNLIREATMLAFNDTFFVMSVMMFCLVPFVFIMRKGERDEDRGGALEERHVAQGERPEAKGKRRKAKSEKSKLADRR